MRLRGIAVNEDSDSNTETTPTPPSSEDEQDEASSDSDSTPDSDEVFGEQLTAKNSSTRDDVLDNTEDPNDDDM